MKKQRHSLILAALVLGLVCAPYTLAQSSSPQFRLINNTGESLSVGCSAVGSPRLVHNGETEEFTCNGTVQVEMKLKNGGHSKANFSFQCASSQIQETTVTVSGELSLAHNCIDTSPSTEEPSES